MIELLAKNHDKWLAMARNICRNTDEANEIVQEMYLKLHGLKKEVNEAYVYFTLKSIYYTILKKSKREVNIDNDILSFVCGEDKEIDQNRETKLTYLDKEINKLDFFDKNILRLSLIEGQTELSKNTGIPLRTIQRTVSKIKEKIKNNYYHVQEQK